MPRSAARCGSCMTATRSTSASATSTPHRTPLHSSWAGAMRRTSTPTGSASDSTATATGARRSCSASTRGACCATRTSQTTVMTMRSGMPSGTSLRAPTVPAGRQSSASRCRSCATTCVGPAARCGRGASTSHARSRGMARNRSGLRRRRMRRASCRGSGTWSASIRCGRPRAWSWCRTSARRCRPSPKRPATASCPPVTQAWPSAVTSA